MAIGDILKIIAVSALLFATWPVIKIGFFELSEGSDRISIAWQTAKTNNFNMRGSDADYVDPASWESNDYSYEATLARRRGEECHRIDGEVWCRSQYQ